MHDFAGIWCRLSKHPKGLLALLLGSMVAGCGKHAELSGDRWRVFETNRAGLRLEESLVQGVRPGQAPAVTIEVHTDDRRQTIEGIGGALTESAAFALGQISPQKRSEVLERYFGPEGAAYSLVRVSMASCDFSTESYTYAPVAGDNELEHFTIDRDRRWVLPLIKDAQAASSEGFRIMASPWTAPPWMKDNHAFFGGKLKPEHYATFARYFVRYIEAYQREGIDIWSLTPENEPLGNDSNWESMEFTPSEMASFIGEHLGPTLEKAGLDPKIYIFDQNRDEVGEWAEGLLHDSKVTPYVDGIAVHWYSHTTDPLPGVLDALRESYPDFPVIQSEGCIDALGDDEPEGVWLKDDWYWRPEATDWGVFWAPDHLKKDHPPYRPFYRYARDLVVGLNHGMIGWIDWNIVLDFQGGPNHARNYCGAPVLVDGETDTVYYTPLFYAVAHFSRFIRPGAVVFGHVVSGDALLALTARNADGSLVAVIFNPTEEPVSYRLVVDGKLADFSISPQGLHTLVQML